MLDAALTTKIVESTPSDQFVVNALVALDVETVPLPRSQKEDWYFDQGTLYYKLCLYIPEPAQHSLVKNIHESLAGAHSCYGIRAPTRHTLHSPFPRWRTLFLH